jgi:hypothetical protein
MKGACGGDNFIGSTQIMLPIAPGQLHRPLISLSPTVAEKDLIQAAILD